MNKLELELELANIEHLIECETIKSGLGFDSPCHDATIKMLEDFKQELISLLNK